MAKPWAEVANSDAYKALAPEQQEAARNQYFDTVVAPRAPQDKIESVRAQFDSATRSAPANPVQQDVQANRADAMQEGQLNSDGSAVVRPNGTTIPFGEPTVNDQPQQPEKKLQLPEYKTRREGFIRGLLDPITAGAQMLTAALPESVNQTMTKGDQWLAEKTGGVLGSPAASHQEAVAQEEAAYQQQRAASGDTGMDGDRIAGNVVATAIPATKMLSGLQKLNVGVKTAGALTGGLMGALTPTTGKPEDFLEEKATQVLGGAAGGALIPAAGQAISSVVMPKAAQNQALQTVLKEGGKPTIGQALGGTIGKIEEKAQSIPIVGDMISRARRKGMESLEPAAYNRALTPLGQKIPAGLSGRDALVHTEKVLKEGYDDVLSKIGAITPDEQFTAKVQSLTDLVDSVKMPQAQKDKFIFAVDKLKTSVDENGVMTSDAFKRLESTLGTQAKKLGSSQDIYEMEMAPAVKQLQVELRDMLTRQAGPQSKQLQKVNEGWANFKVLQKAAGGVGAEDGIFTPTQLQAAVRSADKSKDKAAYARGNALMQDLSEAGKSVMGNRVPDSGTAGRVGLGALAGSAAYALDPMVAAGLGTGAVMYTQPIQNALVRAVASRPDFAVPLAARITQGANAMVPAGSVVGGRIGAGD